MSKYDEQFITGTEDSNIYYDPHWGHIMFRHSGGGIGVKLGSLTGDDFRKLADYVVDIFPAAKAGGFLPRDGNVLPRECSVLR